MKNPELSWYLISAEDSIVIEKEHYLGAYTPDTIEMITNLQLWNNRYGQEIAKDIENSNLKITFSSIEDTKLLEYMQVKIDNNPYEDLTIVNNEAIIPIQRIISGEINVGDNMCVNNYIDIYIKTTLSQDMKNGLKNLLINLDY